jgi:hypothetical protein
VIESAEATGVQCFAARLVAMSVESHTGDNRSKAISQQADKEKERSSAASDMTSACGSIDVSKAATMSEAKKSDKDDKRPTESSAVKSWFKSLDAADRAAAMSHCDARFLSTLLTAAGGGAAAASPSCKLTGDSDLGDCFGGKGEYRFARHTSMDNFAPSMCAAKCAFDCVREQVELDRIFDDLCFCKHRWIIFVGWLSA